VAGCCECGDETSGSCATELVSYNPGPPDLHDISQASVYKGLKLSLNFTCNSQVCHPHSSTDFTCTLNSFILVSLFT
jgi:hypothetical protein